MMFSCAAHGEGLSHKSTGELVMNGRLRPDDFVWIVPCVFTPLKSACLVPCVFVGRYQSPNPPHPIPLDIFISHIIIGYLFIPFLIDTCSISANID